jgi:hypothetical protein
MRNYMMFTRCIGHVYNEFHVFNHDEPMIEGDLAEMQLEQQALSESQPPGWTVEYDPIARFYFEMNKENMMNILFLANQVFPLPFYPFMVQISPRKIWSRGK